MDFFKSLVSLIFFSGIGILILKYRKQVKSWTGNFVWAEHYLGRGGTYLIIILMGAGLIIFGIFDFFGMIEKY